MTAVCLVNCTAEFIAPCGVVKSVAVKEAVQEYVAELAYRYNTCSSTRVFKSTARGKVNVYGGNYGYLINQKSEVKQLTKDLKSGKDVTREPVYAQKGAGRNGNDDI